MKNYKTALCVTAVLFIAGFSACELQTSAPADFRSNEKEYYQVTSNGSIQCPGSITVDTTDIEMADSETIRTVTIVSKGQLDENSINQALDFYPLSPNTEDENYYPVRGNALTKTVNEIQTEFYEDGYSNSSLGWGWFNYSWNGTVTVTTIEYKVNTSAVDKRQIAFVADARKLKTKTGKLILNGNGNDKAGEESDSYIEYIGVLKKQNGDSTDYLPNYAYEDFCPKKLSFYFSENLEIEDGKYTGSFELTSWAPSVRTTEGWVAADSFAPELNKMYSFRYLAPGSSKWVEQPLTWTYDSDHQQYQAKTPAITYGTKYCYVRRTNNNLEWSKGTEAYGHTCKGGWKKDTTEYINSYGENIESEYKYDSGSEIYSVFEHWTDEPDYLMSTWSDYPDNREGTEAKTFDPTSYWSFDIQQNLLKVQVNEQEGYIIISLQDTYNNYVTTRELRLKNYTGFVITYGNELLPVKTKAPVIEERDELGVISVRIELVEKYLNANNFKYWVGSGTSLTGNKVYSKMVNFGCPPTEKKNTLAGYIELSRSWY